MTTSLLQITDIKTQDLIENDDDNDNYSMQSTIMNFNNFSEFDLVRDSIYIDSTNQNDSIFIEYNKSTTINKNYEEYLFDLNKYGDCSDFYISCKVNYTFGEMVQERGSFNLALESDYDEYGELDENRTICYTEIQDAWVENYGVFHLVAFPNGVADDVLTSYGSVNSYDTVYFELTRINEFVNLTIRNALDNEIILMKNWSSGLNRVINKVRLWFRSGFDYSYFSVNLSQISMNFEFNLDNNPPDLSIISPLNDSVISSNNVTVVWEGSDNETGMKAYYAKLDSGEWIDTNLETNYRFEYLSNGLHNVSIKAIDKRFNERICSIVFTINATISSSSYSVSFILSGFTFVTIISTMVVTVSLIRTYKRRWLKS